MDGVLADFNKEYTKHDPAKKDRKRFRDAVLTDRIFEKLDLMPDAHELLNHVQHLHNNGLNVEILTSMGTFDEHQGKCAREQKQVWLDKHKIPYKANFVRSKAEKAQYANNQTILIDDSIGCIAPFIEASGHGILHVNATDSIRILDATIKVIHA
jgi:hypothetical protein